MTLENCVLCVVCLCDVFVYMCVYVCYVYERYTVHVFVCGMWYMCVVYLYTYVACMCVMYFVLCMFVCVIFIVCY